MTPGVAIQVTVAMPLVRVTELTISGPTGPEQFAVAVTVRPWQMAVPLAVTATGILIAIVNRRKTSAK